MKQLLASLAAAATIFSGSSCCSPYYQVMEAEQQCSRQDALEDILQSVVCLRTTTLYQNEEKGEERSEAAFGTGFVYKREDGWTYLTTNNHVGNRPEKIEELELFGAAKHTWKKVKDNVMIIDNRLDENPNDDVPLEVVRYDEGLDTMVLRTRVPLHVAHLYLLSSAQRRSGDVVYVTGIPLAFEKGVTEGVVFNPQVTLENKSYAMLDLTIQPGHSGSPVFVKGDDNHFYLIGQIRMCMPAFFGICGGFGLATPISELQDVWRIDQDEPIPVPDDFLLSPKK